MKPDQVKRFVAYLVERESIRIRKDAGVAFPWTNDAILQKYKFTNVRRVNDRTTQAFLRIYEGCLRSKKFSPADMLYLCGLYRYFGTLRFAELVGTPKAHDPKDLRMVVGTLRNAKEKVFTGAYVITNGGRSEPKELVVIEYLGGLWAAAPLIADWMRSTRSWEEGYGLMQELDGFGGSGFMAKEVLQDWLLCYPDAVDDATTWTPVGPGARRGLNRMWGRPARPTMQQNEEKYITDCLAVLEVVQEPWLRAHRTSSHLSAHDVQFCLCEFDKYERARLGQGRPRGIYRPREER